MKKIFNAYYMAYFLKKYVYRIILVSLLGTIVSILMLYQPKYIGEILNQYYNISGRTILYFLGLTISLFVASSIKFYISKSIAEGIALDLREKFFGKLLYTSVEKISEKNSGEIISTLSNDINVIRDAIGADFFDIFEGVVLFCGSIYFLIMINYKLFIYTALLFVVIIVFSFMSSVVLKKVISQQQRILAEYVSFIEKFFQKIIIIKSFWLIDKLKKNSERLSSEIYKVGLKNAKVRSIIMTMNSLIFQIGIIVVVLLAGLDVNNGDMKLSDLAQFVIYATFLTTPISIIANTVVAINVILAARERILNVYNKLDYYEKRKELAVTNVLESENIIEVSDVSFSYGENTIFDKYSIAFKKNKINLIVGESGVGKTTLVRLLMNLYRVNNGRILIKGNNIYEYSPKYLRTKIFSYVPQESIEWGDSIYDSITLGEEYESSYIEELVNKLNLTKCINSLDDGLNTKIGTVMARLSSGELQRLSILRGIIRKSEILILDEPTANLDKENELLINNLLNKIKNNRTIILISHKEVSRGIADNIIELKRKGD